MILPTLTPPVKVMTSICCVRHHFIADVLGPAGHHLEHFGRQSRLVEDVGKRKRGERRQLGRLAHHAIVGGDGRRHLVRHHVERMVERA